MCHPQLPTEIRPKASVHPYTFGKTLLWACGSIWSLSTSVPLLHDVGFQEKDGIFLTRSCNA